ncbi:MAG: chemotaxis protein CheA [Bacteroidetes bacterium]|jgi:two-component system chemotaxis sensor kinase CheA|nr:chemotaxis protein CheA [Bacteroidota bacterium]
MDAMKLTYIEEANELLANLEISLLALENNSSDKTCIEEIFRVMHTLKGNSSMFGLPVITDFVHDLETIYDKVRSGEMELNKELIDCSFLCLDHIKVIIYDADLENVVNKENHFELLKKIGGFIEEAGSISVNEKKESQAVRTVYVLFEPSAKIFDNGTNPLFLVSELASMGNSKVVPHFKLSENQAHDECFTYWEIFIETDRSENEIRDVFVFVEDNAEIFIKELPFKNVLKNKHFNDLVSKNMYGDVGTNMEELVHLLSDQQNNEPVADAKKEVVIETDVSEAGAIHSNKKVSKEVKEKGATSIRVSSDKLDELMNLVSELVTTQAGLTLFTAKNKTPELETISENVEKLTRRLRDTAFGMTLVPINNMFGRFQRMVRDISSSLGKEVEFVTEGGETELDKTIIETLTDPLMHILRNSLDHGIEKAADRVTKGKSPGGKLILKSFYSGVFVYIQIIDDGKGINVETIRDKAISKGIIKSTDNLSDKEILDLIFYAGFSTAEKITDVSGRGVGMDVVKRNIADLRGNILVESEVNVGTTLTIKLPLTLSIIDGLLVTVDKVNYIIPLSVITKCYSVKNEDMANNFNRLLTLDGEQVPYINLREEFGYTVQGSGETLLIAVNNGDRVVGITVDMIIGEYQAVIKPLGRHHKKQDFVSGASILGDGTIALVLDTNKVIDLYTNNIKREEKTWQLN